MEISSLLFGGQFNEMTSYFSVIFMAVFLPASILIYSITPSKAKKYFLLIASYIFFWLISGKLIIYLFLSTLSIHYFGLWLDRVREKKSSHLKAVEKEERKAVKKKYQTQSRCILAFAIVLHIGILLTIKYSSFFTTNINLSLAHFGASLQFAVPKYIMPIGISFFTLQAVSYLVDVYRGTVKADTNLFRLALFMSFFPQIVEGPICRYKDTADKLWDVKQIKYVNFKLGLERILYGMMKKIVIADRLNPLIQEVFDNYEKYDGGIIAISAVFYTIQLYMDFSGTMDAVMGIAQIFGLTMPENFKRPLFSKSIPEFWKRWHITLGTWFKDYVFYPITISKPMKKLTASSRKKIGNYYGPLLSCSVALFCVWFFNGLWHGAGWNYIFFGLYHFVLIIIGKILTPVIKQVNEKLHINKNSFIYKGLQIIRTTIFVIIGELFFRANGLHAGLTMFKSIVTDFTFAAINDEMLSKLGTDRLDLIIVGITMLIIFVVSILNEKGIIVRDSLNKKPVYLRWAILYALIIYIIVFGAYGFGYVPVDPIYANF